MCVPQFDARRPRVPLATLTRVCLRVADSHRHGAWSVDGAYPGGRLRGYADGSCSLGRVRREDELTCGVCSSRNLLPCYYPSARGMDSSFWVEHMIRGGIGRRCEGLSGSSSTSSQALGLRQPHTAWLRIHVAYIPLPSFCNRIVQYTFLTVCWNGRPR